MIQRLSDIYYDSQKKTLMRRTQAGVETLMLPEGSEPELYVNTDQNPLYIPQDNGGVLDYTKAVVTFSVFVMGVEVTDSCTFMAAGTGITGSFGTGADRAKYSISAIVGDFLSLGVNITHPTYGTKAFTQLVRKGAKDGKPGIGIYYRMRYRRSATKPAKPLSYTDPLWTELIPTGTDPLWGSSALLTEEGGVPGLLPGDALYPGESLYPSGEYWTEPVLVMEQGGSNPLANLTPKYLGALTADPVSANAGDFYFAKTLTPKKLRRYSGSAWADIATSDTRYSEYLAAALNDIVAQGTSLASGDDGFAFIETLAVMQAFIKKLFTNEVTLLAQGFLRSYNYAETAGVPTAGFKLDVANQVIKAFGAIFNNATVAGQFTGRVLANSIVSTLAPGDVPLVQNAAYRTATPYPSTYTLFQTITLKSSGTVRIYARYGMVNIGGAASGTPIPMLKAVIKFAKNGVDCSPEYEYSSQTDTYQEVSLDISISEGDVIQLYVKYVAIANLYIERTYYQRVGYMKASASEEPGQVSRLLFSYT